MVCQFANSSASDNSLPACPRGPVVQVAQEGSNERTSRLSGIMVSPDASECDAVAGVVWSTPMWYTIGAISRSAVCAALTEERVEW
jgi:hypothetical protein